MPREDDQPGQALVQPADDLLGVAASPRPGRSCRWSRAPRTGCRCRARVGHLGGVQDRLGRDAAAVQAGAADLVLLDQRDAQPELGRAQRAGVAAAARARAPPGRTRLPCRHPPSPPAATVASRCPLHARPRLAHAVHTWPSWVGSSARRARASSAAPNGMGRTAVGQGRRRRRPPT